MTREEYKKEIFGEPSSTKVYKSAKKYIKSLEAQLKAKDELIKVLECRAYHAEGYICDLHNNPEDKKFYDKQARSIVAMLFWKMKRQKKVFQKYYEAYGHNNSLTNCYLGMFEQALMDFNKSRKMLKDTK